MTADPAPASTAPVVHGVHPAPTDEEAVAIAAALEVGWPRLVVAGAPEVQAPRWRFSGRWWSRPVPQRRARP